MAVIRGEIRSQGPLAFSRFQELALYHPELGYYSRGAGIGREGADFWTAPEMTPVFGELVGVQMEEMFRLAGEPESFQVVEVGAGSGALADGILSAWVRQGSPLYRPGGYAIQEASPALVHLQRQRLRAHGEMVRWHQPGDQPPWTPRPTGVVVMNEVLDALPVDRVMGREGGIEEIRVGLDGEELVEIRCPPRRELVAELQRVLPGGGTLAPGQQAELRSGLGRFLEQVTAGLGPGYLMVMDYGFPAEDLYASRWPNGTLLAYHRHQATEELLERVGRQDLTAHVDLTALAREAGRLGFQETGWTTQMRFLLALGLGERIEALEEMPLSEAERTQQRLAMTALIRPGGMGEMFKVWIGSRQVPAAARGLQDLLAPR